MWWRLALIFGLTAAVLTLLFWPVHYDFRVDLPPVRGAPQGRPGEVTVYDTTWVNVAVVVLILLAAAWAAVRVVRRHKKGG